MLTTLPGCTAQKLDVAALYMMYKTGQQQAIKKSPIAKPLLHLNER
jgi:hypothetical protein